ncbi:MAG: endonuclease/exonuclease/phosphatase family protein [Bacteroidales bacterium]|nr:endonuclease/exonuclease/phosphatase family protein [Bacteroidales bacterium]
MSRHKKKGTATIIVLLFLLCNVLAVLGLLFAYSSLFISPEKWWLPAFAGLTYPYIALLNLIFVLGWLFIKPKYIWLSLIALLAGFFIGNRYIQLNYTDEFHRTENHIKILSYNSQMFNLNQRFGEENTEKLSRNINMLHNINADIICLQEAFIKNRYSELIPAQIADHLSMPYYTYKSYREGYTGGLAIVSKYRIINKDKILCNDRTIALYADILLNKDTCRLYNFHLESTYLGHQEAYVVDSFGSNFYQDSLYLSRSRLVAGKLKRAYIARAIQAEILRKHIDTSPYRVIIVGDLNDPPCSFSYQKLRKGHYDAFIKAGRGMSKTYNGKYPSFRIDYIFYDKAFKSVDYVVIKKGTSDHFPIYAILEKRGEK